MTLASPAQFWSELQRARLVISNIKFKALHVYKMVLGDKHVDSPAPVQNCN